MRRHLSRASEVQGDGRKVGARYMIRGFQKHVAQAEMHLSLALGSFLIGVVLLSVVLKLNKIERVLKGKKGASDE